ncbi:hypothetical protein GYMLUDRAFT_234947 [Collybiopsis luxurians FD-317 M1]|nr:hypothetical protein GYMLUDRAFT_234947 [Collybiopsis luxurians FD-317 M1]
MGFKYHPHLNVPDKLIIASGVFVSRLYQEVAHRRLATDFQTGGRSPGSLTFQESSIGASDQAVWTVKGAGSASTKAEAKNLASKQALQALGVPLI